MLLMLLVKLVLLMLLFYCYYDSDKKLFLKHPQIIPSKFYNVSLIPHTVNYSLFRLYITAPIHSIIFYPIPYIIVLVVVNLSNWFDNLINGHIKVGVFVNFSFCNKDNKLMIQFEKLSRVKISL